MGGNIRNSQRKKEKELWGRKKMIMAKTGSKRKKKGPKKGGIGKGKMNEFAQKLRGQAT